MQRRRSPRREQPLLPLDIADEQLPGHQVVACRRVPFVQLKHLACGEHKRHGARTQLPELTWRQRVQRDQITQLIRVQRFVHPRKSNL